MKKLVLIAGFILMSFSSIQADDMKIVTTTKVYEVPLKFTDQYSSMIQEGKLIKTDTKVMQKKNVFQYESTVVIFPSDNKYENMNILLETVRSYAKGLDNLDSKTVDRVLSLLKVEGTKSGLQ